MSKDSSKPIDQGEPPVDSTRAGKPSQKLETPLSQKVPWGPLVAVLYAAAVYFAAQIIGSILIALYPRLSGWKHSVAINWLDNSVVAQFWYVLFAEALTFAAIWWFIRHRKGNLRSIGWTRFRAWYPMATVAGFAVYFIGYVVMLTIATHLFPALNVNQKQQLGFQNATGSTDLTLAFLSLVVLPPLVEETVFRGFVFTGIRNKLNWVWAAILTSALFASAHLEFGNGQPLLWVAAIDTFCLSLVLCYLRQKTDSLWPGIMLHALKNCIAFVTLFILHAS
jgi:membrane protease YdiL (CAAX protease family)